MVRTTSGEGYTKKKQLWYWKQKTLRYITSRRLNELRSALGFAPLDYPSFLGSFSYQEWKNNGAGLYNFYGPMLVRFMHNKIRARDAELKQFGIAYLDDDEGF